MPLMRDWVEITVEESLLIPVVQELLALATNPNHVEVVYGTTGRVILAKTELADEWYRYTQKKDTPTDEGKVDDGEDTPQTTEVVGHGYEVVAVANEKDAAANTFSETEPLPVKRGPGRPRKNPLPPSPPLNDGEES